MRVYAGVCMPMSAVCLIKLAGRAQHPVHKSPGTLHVYTHSVFGTLSDPPVGAQGHGSAREWCSSCSARLQVTLVLTLSAEIMAVGCLLYHCFCPCRALVNLSC